MYLIALIARNNKDMDGGSLISGQFLDSRGPVFRVTACPWLTGRVEWWSQAGVTVQLKTPNHPYGDDQKPPETPLVGNYTGRIQISAYTEVTAL